MLEILFQDPNDDTRFVPLTVIKADGTPADTGVAGNPAKLYVNDLAASETDTGPLVAVNAARGQYKAPLTSANIAGMMPNDKGRVSYDDGATLPADGFFVIVPNPYAHLGTAAGGTANTAVLAASASATNDAYNGLVFESMAPTAWMRGIADYDGATKIVTFDTPAPAAPGVTTKYVIYKEAPQRDGIADLLGTTPAGAVLTVGALLKRLGDLAIGAGGEVTVGTIVQGAADFVVTRMQAAGTVLARLTQAITDKLALLVVDGTGKVTTSNPGGLTGAQDTLLTNIGADTADLRARITVTITDKLGRLAVSVAGAVDASNVEASGLTSAQNDALTAAAQNSNALLQRVTQAIMDAMARLDVGNDGSVKVGSYTVGGQQVLGALLDQHLATIQFPAFPAIPSPTAVADAVETRKNVFADALLDRANAIVSGGWTPRLVLRALWLNAAIGGRITGMDGSTGNNLVTLFTPDNTAAGTFTADRYGNRVTPPQWNMGVLADNAKW